MSVVGPNSYGNYLARLRAERYLQNAPDCVGTCVLNPPPSTDPPDMVSPDVVPSTGGDGSEAGRVLSQARLRNFHVAVGAAFARDADHQVCAVPFSVPPSDPAHPPKTRLVRVCIRLLLVDTAAASVSGPDRLFLVATHGNHVVYCQQVEYPAADGADARTPVVDADFFLDVPAHPDAPAHHLAVYAASTSDACYISANYAPYTSAFPVGCSYVTLTDCGSTA